MDTLQQLRDELTYEYTVTKNFFDNYPEEKTTMLPMKKA